MRQVVGEFALEGSCPDVALNKLYGVASLVADPLPIKLDPTCKIAVSFEPISFRI